MKDKREKEQENEACEAIRDRIQKGNDRADKMKSWLTNRPPIYAQTYADMQARGEIVTERDGKKYRLRFTNAAERTAAQTMENQTMPEIDLKKVLRFDDSKFQVFDAEVTRVNLGLADEQGKRFNAMAKELDVAPLRLLRDTIEFILTVYSIEPQMFIEESQRAHQRAAEAFIAESKRCRLFNRTPDAH